MYTVRSDEEEDCLTEKHVLIVDDKSPCKKCTLNLQNYGMIINNSRMSRAGSGPVFLPRVFGG